MDTGRKASWVEALDGDWSAPLRLRVRGGSMRPSLRPGDRVTVERAAAADLRRGDWVLLRGQDGVFLHRLLGFTREGLLLTKGDAHRAADHPWPREAAVGRVVTVTRGERTDPVSACSLRQRVWTGVHRLVAASWSLLRRAGLLALALLVLGTATARAAVELIEDSLQAIPDVQSIRVTWETASEVDALAFYVQRTIRGGEYEYVSGMIVAYGDVIGALYEFVDTDVVVGPTYFYRLEAVDIFGVSEFYGPVTASLVPPATETPVPTATPTATATPTVTPAPLPSTTPSTAGDDPAPGPGSGPAPGTTPDPAGGGGGLVPAAPTRTPRPAAGASPPQPSVPVPSSSPSGPSAQVAAATPGLTGTPGAAASPGPAAMAGSGAAAGSPTPTPTPPAHPVAEKDLPPLPCGLLLALIIAGCILIALGLWGAWRRRRQAEERTG
jgi:hypothetical protein